MYSMSCGTCKKSFAPANSKDRGYCKCLVLERTSGEASVINQEDIKITGNLHKLILSQQFDTFNDIITQKNSGEFIIDAVFLKRIFFLENIDHVSISGLFLLQPIKLQRVLSLRPDLIINYLYIDILPPNWTVIDGLLRDKLLTSDLIHAALKLRKFDISTASKSRIMELKNGLVARKLLNNFCDVIYFGANPSKLSTPNKITSTISMVFNSTKEALRAKLLFKQIGRQLERHNQEESAAAANPPEEVPEIDFSEFEEKPAATKKKKKKKKTPTIIVKEACIESTVPDDVSTEIVASEEPEHTNIDEPLALPCDVAPVIEPHTSPISSPPSAPVYEKKVGLNRKQTKIAVKNLKSMADLKPTVDLKSMANKLNSRDNWTLLKALATFQSTKKQSLANAPEEQISILQAPLASPEPHGYYLYPADFPKQLHSVMPLLKYLESHNYAPIIYGSMVTKSLLTMLQIENTLEPRDIDIVLYNAPGLGEHLAKSGGTFEPNIYNSKNPNYEQYHGSFEGVSIDITVQKEGYKTSDPVDFSHFRLIKDPKNVRFEFKLKSQKEKNFEADHLLESAVRKITKGQFDIFLPQLSDRRVIYKGYFSRVIKCILTWNNIFPLFQTQRGSNLDYFLCSSWKDSYIHKLNGYFTNNGVSFAYLELADLIIKHNDKLNNPLIENVLTSFFKVILADAFRPGLINHYKQAVLINTTGSELKKEDVIKNIEKLRLFIKYHFSSAPAYQDITTEPLESIFSACLPSYPEAISASASCIVFRYG